MWRQRFSSHWNDIFARYRIKAEELLLAQREEHHHGPAPKCQRRRMQREAKEWQLKEEADILLKKKSRDDWQMQEAEDIQQLWQLKEAEEQGHSPREEHGSPKSQMQREAKQWQLLRET